jgi:beta-glucanase (GH16 family)
MKFLVLFVVIVILVRQSMSKWVLKWNDEFDNEAIDTNKWEIENEWGKCNG